MSTEEEELELDHLETSSLLGLGAALEKGSASVRQRGRMGSDSSGYSRTGSSDEELDSLPTLYQQERLVPLHPPGNSCAMCCFFFSLAGVVFLFIIAFLLGSNSLYFKVSRQNELQKPKLVEGVLGAACMYLACAVLSGWYWYRNSTILPPSSYHVAVD